MTIAICFHLGYSCKFTHFTKYIDNVMTCYPQSDIYITYRPDQIDPVNMCHQKYPKAVMLQAHKGCDTGAFLLQIDYILRSGRKYDYIFKIHTKSNNQVFDNWKRELLDPVAGKCHNIQLVMKLFEQDSTIGAIGSRKWLLKTDIDFDIFTHLCDQLAVDKNGQFFGGTIFWIRFTIIEQFFTHIDIDHYYQLCELGKPSEPSHTHSWERLFGLIVTTLKYRMCGC